METDPAIDLVVIGIDPGMMATAVVRVGFDCTGKPSLLSSSRITPDVDEDDPIFKKWGTERQRLCRIWNLRTGFAMWFGNQPAFDAIGYELPGHNGTVAKAVHQTTGALLALSQVWEAGVPIIAVNNSDAGAVYQSKVAAGRVSKKAAAVAWANETFGLSLTQPEGEDIADACAVAVATRNLYLNPKAPKKRKRKPDATQKG